MKKTIAVKPRKRRAAKPSETKTKTDPQRRPVSARHTKKVVAPPPTVDMKPTEIGSLEEYARILGMTLVSLMTLRNCQLGAAKSGVLTEEQQVLLPPLMHALDEARKCCVRQMEAVLSRVDMDFLEAFK